MKIEMTEEEFKSIHNALEYAYNNAKKELCEARKNSDKEKEEVKTKFLDVIGNEVDKMIVIYEREVHGVDLLEK